MPSGCLIKRRRQRWNVTSPLQAPPLRLGIADQDQLELHEELAAAVEDAAGEAGISVRRVRDPSEERDVDVLLFLGRPRRYPTLVAAPKTSYRLCWYGENLPVRPPKTAERLLSAPPRRVMTALHAASARLLAPAAGRRMGAVRQRALIEREWSANLRELQHAHRRGLIDELVVTSPGRVGGAALAGWTSRVVPFGYHPRLAGLICPPDSGVRDIPILLFGRVAATTVGRERLLSALERRLGEELPLRVIGSGLYGRRRYELLARTRIVVHVHRLPRATSGVRYVLATAAGAALVAEESDDEWLPDRPHRVVETALDGLADAVRALAADEERRRRLVKAGQQLLTGDWSMANSLVGLLEGWRETHGGEGRRA